MKKVFIIAFILFFGANAAIAAETESRIIAEDFYTSGRRSIDENVVAVTSVLPNTLVVSLARGEEAEIRADVMPEDATDTEVRWSLPEGRGIVNIFSDGRKCTIRALAEGNETVRVDAADGAYSLVKVRVTAAAMSGITLECVRPSIESGEETVIRAAVDSENPHSDEVAWRVISGEENAELVIRDNICRVIGKKPGDVVVGASLAGGSAERRIELSVTEPPTDGGDATVFRTLVRAMLALAAILLLSAVFAFFARRGRSRYEDKK